MRRSQINLQSQIQITSNQWLFQNTQHNRVLTKYKSIQFIWSIKQSLRVEYAVKSKKLTMNVYALKTIKYFFNLLYAITTVMRKEMKAVVTEINGSIEAAVLVNTDEYCCLIRKWPTLFYIHKSDYVILFYNAQNK